MFNCFTNGSSQNFFDTPIMAQFINNQNCVNKGLSTVLNILSYTRNKKHLIQSHSTRILYRRMIKSCQAMYYNIHQVLRRWLRRLCNWISIERLANTLQQSAWFKGKPFPASCKNINVRWTHQGSTQRVFPKLRVKIIKEKVLINKSVKSSKIKLNHIWPSPFTGSLKEV